MFLDLFAFQSFSASISSLTLGGLLNAFILVQDQSWGLRRIRGFPCVFSGFLFFPFRSTCFFQDFAVALQELLARPKPDIVWCDINGEPLSFVGPTVSAELVSKDPSLANLAQLRFRHPDYFQAGSLHDHVDFWDYQPSRQLAQAAAFILLFLLTSAGYFVNLAKSSPEPSTFVKFLGFFSDSIVQAFFIPPDKKEKFRALREELLGSPCAPVKACNASQGKHYPLVLQFRPASCMYEKCLKQSPSLPRILRFLS